MKKYVIIIIAIALVIMGASSCSIKKLAMNSVANALTGEGSSAVFTGDNDPELVAGALPFAIKMYESLLSSLPNHMGLRVQTGSLYVMYANAFLYTPATMMTDDQYLAQERLMKRAKNLYLRGRDMLMKGLEIRYPGFLTKMKKKQYDAALQTMQKKDVPLLFWSAAGWLGAFAIDPFDMKLGITLPGAGALMKRVAELDSRFNEGAIHDFYITYYGALPDYMGGSNEKARFHYKKALELAEGRSTSPYVSFASTISVETQNVKEFRSMLKKVLAFDLNRAPENMLVNILNRRKAQWLLEHIEDIFVEVDKVDQPDKTETPDPLDPRDQQE